MPDRHRDMSPIRPEERSRYPPRGKWEEIRKEILQRARGRCEKCQARNHWWALRRNDGFLLGNFASREAALDCRRMVLCELEPVRQPVRIVLTIAHLNHTPEDNRPENLAALCQRCHLQHDSRHHAENARRSRRAKRAEKGLFSQED